MDRKRILLALVVFMALGLLLTINPRVAGRAGILDFRAYWSASYLLAQGENFSDPDLLLATERELTGFQWDFQFATWNPPWLLTILLPYTQVSFERAVWWWILTNTALLFLSTVLIWRMNMPAGKEDYRVWLALLVTFTFSSTLLTMYMGQVNLLVLAGLALFLYFWPDRPGMAGAALVLVTIKPHLVYLALPLIFLKCWRERNFRMFVGFGTALAVLTVVVFFLRPTFVGEYLQTIGGGSLTQYASPALGGFVQFMTGNSGLKWGLLLLLPILLVVLWPRLPDLEMKSMTEGLVILSVLTMPFGWSYDFVVLLLPLLFVFAQIALGRLGRRESLLLIGVYLLANLLSFAQRVITTHESYYVWLNVVIAGLYFWTSWRTGRLFFQRPEPDPMVKPLQTQ